MEHRPKLKLQMTLADKLLEAAAGVAFIALWIIVLYGYNTLPNVVPVHFNLAGEADGYGTKATVFLLPLIGTALFIAMTFISAKPHHHNYLTEITPENAVRQYTNSARLIRYLKFAVMSIFAILEYHTYRVATSSTGGLGSLIFLLVPGIIIIPMIYFLIQSSRNK